MIEDTAAARVNDTAPIGFVEYEIDIERILRADLPPVLDRMSIAPLTQEGIAAVPAGARGAYVLYENDYAVYAGKTDAKHGFRQRLAKHAETIRHRRNIDPAAIGFRAVRIFVFSNLDVEAILIKELRKIDRNALKWNSSGFGSNDPGRNRETQEPAPWDVARPINIDQPLSFMPTGSLEVLRALVALKEGLPYDFRYETDLNEKGKPKRHTVGHVDQRGAPAVEITADPEPTLRSVLCAILSSLPNGWRATVFPGRVILYRENTLYPYALEYLPQAAPAATTV